MTMNGWPSTSPTWSNRTSVRVIERGRGPCFRPQALHRLFVVGKILRHELDGDFAPEAHVFRAINDTHPARTQLGEDSVIGSGPSNASFVTRTSAEGAGAFTPASCHSTLRASPSIAVPTRAATTRAVRGQ